MRERHEAVEAGERAIAALHARGTALEHELDAARRDWNEANRLLEEARATLNLVVNSRSWKLTRPLRFAARTARALLASLRFRARRVLELGKRGHRSLRMRGLAGTIARLRRGLAPADAPAPALAVPVLPAARPDDALPVVPGSAAPRVSIVIPVYNQFHYTRTCLASLAEHAGPIAFEAIVVDDRSSDETVERLPLVEGIRAVRNEENLGFIGACNAGAALARGEFVVFLNNDTAVQPGWLEALVDTFERFPDCGLAGAKLVYPDGRLQEAGGIVFSDGSGWNYGRHADPSDPAFNYVREADYCSGAAIMLRRALLEQLGGFDTRYRPAYYEDTDLAFRVREAGLKAYYQPASVVVHFEGVTSGTDTATGIKRYQVVNQEKFVERWKGALARQPKPGTAIEVAREHRRRGTVLIVDAYVPEPDQDSGSVRLVNLMKLLVATGWKVVFAPDNRAYVPRYTAALQQLGVEVLYHPWYRDPLDWLKRHGARLDAAIVLRHYVAVSYVPLLRQYAPRARVIFDTVDLHYLREQRLAQLNGDAELARAAAKTRAQELKLVRECDVTLVVSPVERELLAVEAPGARVEVLSNVHEVNGARHPFAERKDVWFVGGFQHPPNVDAMQWFVHEVWPRIAQRLPDARFHIVGSKMPESVRALAGERVVAHGHVPDIAPFLDGCRIAVAPLRYGAGVKGKVNQSMAHGQPVVATPMAVEGMQVVPGEDALVAESPDAFADAVVALYGDEALWTKLSAGGVRNVERAFSFDAAREALSRILPR
ncbi:MAG TPA: glycosyltransferase [Xanthomonadales bacterium]|nr:glycosyltransferase [Xanthomonadales bacterium]